MTPLQTAVLALSATTPGVVDRVEGDLAVVEWSTDRWSDLPLDLLPVGTREGDAVLVLTLRPAAVPAAPSAPPGPPPSALPTHLDLTSPSLGGAVPPPPPTAADLAAGATP